MLKWLRADPDDNGIGILDSTSSVLKDPSRAEQRSALWELKHILKEVGFALLY